MEVGGDSYFPQSHGHGEDIRTHVGKGRRPAHASVRLGWWNGILTSQIPQYIWQNISQCVFCNKNVHISVTKWCIVGYGTSVLCDLWIRSIRWWCNCDNVASYDDDIGSPSEAPFTQNSRNLIHPSPQLTCPIIFLNFAMNMTVSYFV